MNLVYIIQQETYAHTATLSEDLRVTATLHVKVLSKAELDPVGCEGYHPRNRVIAARDFRYLQVEAFGGHLLSSVLEKPPTSTTMLRSARWQLQTPGGIRRLPLSASRRGYAAVAALSSVPKVGEQLHGFTLRRVKQVPELKLTALHLEHDKTGAEYLHIARDDANNVFSIGFKTNPPDDTGVPHILEHTTLCGSERSVPPHRLAQL